MEVSFSQAARWLATRHISGLFYRLLLGDGETWVKKKGKVLRLAGTRTNNLAFSNGSAASSRVPIATRSTLTKHLILALTWAFHKTQDSHPQNISGWASDRLSKGALAFYVIMGPPAGMHASRPGSCEPIFEYNPPPTKRPCLPGLPQEIIDEILEDLLPSDRRHICLVCRSLRDAVYSQAIHQLPPYIDLIKQATEPPNIALSATALYAFSKTWPVISALSWIDDSESPLSRRLQKVASKMSKQILDAPPSPRNQGRAEAGCWQAVQVLAPYLSAMQLQQLITFARTQDF